MLAVGRVAFVELALCAFGVAQQNRCTYNGISQQCPLDSGPQDDPVSSTISGTLSAVQMVSAPWPMKVFSDIMDISGFCDAKSTPSDAFVFRSNATYWAADCQGSSSFGCPRIGVAGQSCTLSKVLVAPTQAQTAPAELRLVFGSCDSGRPLAVSVYIGKDVGQDSNLVRWMCEVGGLDCQDASKLQKELTTTPKPQNLTSTITVGRQIIEKVIGRGLCNNAGLLSDDVKGKTEDGCRLECVQRIEMQVSNNNIDLSKECTGFSFNSDSKTCLLYFAKAVTASDNVTQTTVCISLSQGHDTYAHRTTATTTTTTSTVTAKPPEQLNIGFTLSASVANRRLISPTTDLGGCFGMADWYELDHTLSVPSSDWNTLKVFMKGRPGPNPGELVPSNMVVDRVCVMGCDGTLAEGCSPPGDSWLIPLLLLTNLITAIVVYCCLEHCCKQTGETALRAVDSVTYTDGERVKALK